MQHLLEVRTSELQSIRLYEYKQKHTEGQIKAVDCCHSHLAPSNPDFYIVNHLKIPVSGILNSKPPPLLIRCESFKAQEKLY